MGRQHPAVCLTATTTPNGIASGVGVAAGTEQQIDNCRFDARHRLCGHDAGVGKIDLDEQFNCNATRRRRIDFIGSVRRDWRLTDPFYPSGVTPRRPCACNSEPYIVAKQS